MFNSGWLGNKLNLQLRSNGTRQRECRRSLATPEMRQTPFVIGKKIPHWGGAVAHSHMQEDLSRSLAQCAQPWVLGLGTAGQRVRQRLLVPAAGATGGPGHHCCPPIGLLRNAGL